MANPSEPPSPSPSSEAAFEALFASQYRSVNYYFARRGCTPDESRELTQETFIAVYRGFDGYRQESAVSTWIFMIAANTWRNWLRQRGTQKRTANEISMDDTEGERRIEETVADPAEDALDNLMSDERREQLRDALDELPPRMRDCLLLRLDQGYKYREIAEIMNTRVDTVKSQLYQAKERLKDLLQDHAELI
ncbi:MAG: sigma-70 family RNA polymerase sigma factor [Acidobacteriota bacterium]